MAILAGSIVDYELISDHTRPGCALGLPSGNGEVSGDLAMARFIAKRDGGGSTSALLGGPSEEGAALMDQWVDYALSVSKFGLARRALSVQRTLDSVLVSGTYVLGHAISLADVALFAALGFPASDDARAGIASILPGGCPTLRWVDMIARHPAVSEAAQLASNVARNDEAALEAGEALDRETSMNASASLLDADSLFEMCREEQHVLQVLEDEQLCYKCFDEAGGDACIQPFSLVSLARAYIKFSETRYELLFLSVYEVLSHKNWGASSTLMNEIAQDTFDYERCELHILIGVDGQTRARGGERSPPPAP